MRKISVKIFFGLMGAFLIILAMSMKINVDAQFQLHGSLLQQSYGFSQIFEEIKEKFPIVKIPENKSEEYTSKLIKEVQTLEFKEKFSVLSGGTGNFVFLTTPYENFTTELHQEDSNDSLPTRDKILFSTFNQRSFESNYISLQNGDGKSYDYSIQFLSDQQRESLSSHIQSGGKTDNQDDIEMGRVDFVVENNKITYLKWGNEFYGEEPDAITSINIYNYNIDGKHYRYDFLRGTYDSFSVDDMKDVVENYIDFRSGDGSYVSTNFTIKDNTYVVMETPYYSSEDGGGSSFVVVNVVHGLRDYVTRQYIEQSTWLYVGVFFMAIVVSGLFSYMITKPIRKVEKAAMKIASQNFDEPLIVKSKDEIGSLAKSVDSMRIQLKETIENLQKEIEKVRNLESLRKDFINQFTHEMKTPLGIINGYSELIEETRNEEEVNKYLNIINRETNRVNELIQSMLKLSRLEAKKVELNKQDIDLEESVVSIVDEYEVLLMKKNIRVEVHVNQPTIYADKKLIETVIHNFLSNAIKHTKEYHKIIIDIDNGVSIFNEGNPIEGDKIENIWYTFVTHDTEGSGLGLAICRSILDLHEFEYGVENKNKGVTFYFKDKN